MTSLGNHALQWGQTFIPIKMILSQYLHRVLASFFMILLVKMRTEVTAYRIHYLRLLVNIPCPMLDKRAKRAILRGYMIKHKEFGFSVSRGLGFLSLVGLVVVSIFLFSKLLGGATGEVVAYQNPFRAIITPPTRRCSQSTGAYNRVPTPTGEPDKPLSCPKGMKSNGRCEKGCVVVSVANCCIPK